MESFEFKGLQITPVDRKLTEEEMKKRLTFEGAIASERVKGQDFHYFLMPKYELNTLLERLKETAEEEHQVYQIKGDLVSSQLKNVEVDGEYLATKWGLIRIIEKATNE